jgi:hypothetical protein
VEDALVGALRCTQDKPKAPTPENLDSFRNQGERGEFFVLSPMGSAQSAVMVAALEPAACESEEDALVGALRCAQDKLKLRPPENRDSFREPLWRTVTALGGAFDLDCCAVDQDFGDALHQLV